VKKVWIPKTRELPKLVKKVWVLWVLHAGFRVGPYGLALAVLVYTPGVLRGALRLYFFFDK
jgi:hypothetical protein